MPFAAASAMWDDELGTGAWDRFETYLREFSTSVDDFKSWAARDIRETAQDFIAKDEPLVAHPPAAEAAERCVTCLVADARNKPMPAAPPPTPAEPPPAPPRPSAQTSPPPAAAAPAGAAAAAPAPAPQPAVQAPTFASAAASTTKKRFDPTLRCKFWGPGTPNDCRRGDSCSYLHVDDDAPTKPAAPNSAPAGLPPPVGHPDGRPWRAGDDVEVAFGGEWLPATIIGAGPLGSNSADPQGGAWSIRWQDQSTSDGVPNSMIRPPAKLTQAQQWAAVQQEALKGVLQGAMKGAGKGGQGVLTGGQIYGGGALEMRQDPMDGQMRTKGHFIERYGGYKEWDLAGQLAASLAAVPNAAPVTAELIEKEQQRRAEEKVAKLSRRGPNSDKQVRYQGIVKRLVLTGTDRYLARARTQPGPDGAPVPVADQDTPAYGFIHCDLLKIEYPDAGDAWMGPEECSLPWMQVGLPVEFSIYIAAGKPRARDIMPGKEAVQRMENGRWEMNLGGQEAWEGYADAHKLDASTRAALWICADKHPHAMHESRDGLLRPMPPGARSADAVIMRRVRDLDPSVGFQVHGLSADGKNLQRETAKAQRWGGWMCEHCNMANDASNAICGGDSRLGCKWGRRPAHVVVPPDAKKRRVPEAGAGWRTAGGADWVAMAAAQEKGAEFGNKEKKKCKFFGYSNGCRKGKDCKFRHDEMTEAERQPFTLSAPIESPVMDPAKTPCRWYGPGTRNDCKRGQKCPYIHINAFDDGPEAEKRIDHWDGHAKTISEFMYSRGGRYNEWRAAKPEAALVPGGAGDLVPAGVGGVADVHAFGRHASHAAAVEEMKRRLGQDEVRQAWQKHCDETSGGQRDPKFHPTGFLEKFIVAAAKAWPTRKDKERQREKACAAIGAVMPRPTHPCERQWGNCRFGDSCVWRWAPPEACYWHLAGTCNRSRCKNPHVDPSPAQAASAALMDTLRSARTAADVAQALRTAADADVMFTPVHVSTAAHRTAKLGGPAQAEAILLVESIARETGAFQWMKHQDFANCLWACAKVHCPPMFMQVEEALHQTGFVDFTPQEFANVMWALAKVGRYESPLWPMVEAAIQAEGLDGFNPQNFANSMWAVVKAGRNNSSLLPQCEAYLVRRGLADFESRHIANMLWATAKASRFGSPLFALSEAQMSSLNVGAFGAQDFANILRACAKAGRTDSALFLQLEEALFTRGVNGFAPQDIGQVLWSIAMAGRQQSPLFTQLESAMRTQGSEWLQTCDVVERKDVLWALGELPGEEHAPLALMEPLPGSGGDFTDPGGKSEWEQSKAEQALYEAAYAGGGRKVVNIEDDPDLAEAPPIE